MTVQTTEFRQPFVGNDVTVTFPLRFPFIDRTHLVATRIPSAGGAPEVLSIIDSTGDSLNGGWGITLSAPVGTGYILWVERVTPVLQPRPWTPNDKFPAKAHEGAHDRAIMIIQELAGRLSLGQLSTDPATFIEGLELVVGPALQPGQIGYATDSKAILLKLQDGSIVRIPVDGDGGEGAEMWAATYFNANMGEIDDEALAQGMIEQPSSEDDSNDYAEFGDDAFDPRAGFELEASGYFKAWGTAHALGFAVQVFDKDETNVYTSSIPLSAIEYDPAKDLEYTFRFRMIPDGTNPVPAPGVFSYTVEAEYFIEGMAGPARYASRPSTLPMYEANAPFRPKFGVVCGGNSNHAVLQRKIIYSKASLGGGSPGAQLIGTAGGDLSGTYPAPSVVGLRGKALPSLPAGRAILTWTGTAWELAESDPRPIVEVESFNYASGKLVRDSLEEIWSDTDANGCFCWVTPCEGWESIKYARTTFCAKVFGWEPKFAIWGWTGSIADPWVLLKDGEWSSINGLSARESLDIDLATPGYKWVKMATDPGPLIAPEWVCETGFVYPPAVQSAPFPNASGFVGERASWLDPFGTDFPEIIAEDPKYLVTKWMALGVQISAS